MQKKEDSILKRYLFRLGTNIFNIPIGILSQSLIARGLGSAGYGNFSFLTNSFTSIFNFIDSGTSTYYYTKLSQTPNDKKLIKFYWLFSIFIVILLIVIVLGLNIGNTENFIWPDQEFSFIMMALVYTMLLFTSSILQKMLDAFGLTVKGDIQRLLIKISGVVILLIIYITIKLSLGIFFIYNYIISFALLVSFIVILKRNSKEAFPVIRLSYSDLKSYTQQFYLYSHPLLLLSFFIFISSLLDIWLLQKVSGSAQQGYYGFAKKIAAICFIFASSISAIVTREYSISYAKNDIENMRKIFQTYIPSIYSIIAFISVFISINSYSITGLLGGKEFQTGYFALSIMALYPIHQTYGRLSGSIFFATGNTKRFRNISLSTIPIGILFTLFILLPENYGGLNLGAWGLALKLVIIQIITINIQLYWNARFLSLSFSKYLFHQIYVIVVFSAIAGVSMFIASNFVKLSQLMNLLTSGFLYTILTGILLSVNSYFVTLNKKIKIYTIIKLIYLKISNRK